MTEANDKPALLTPRKIAFQVGAWLVGLGLLAWVIHGAVQKGSMQGPDGRSGWDHLREADPWLVTALLGCTVMSAAFNGTTFWLVLRPFRPLRWVDMQLLNLVANMLNYAPVRLGAVARVMYHLRVDRVSILQLGAAFGLVAYALAMGVGACVLASLVLDEVNWFWLGAVLGIMACGGFMARLLAGNQLVHRYGRGIDRLATDRRAVWGTIGLRMLDLGAYTGRMAAAMSMLNMNLSASHVVILAMVALGASLMPVGKVGFREFCVAAIAQRLSMESTDVSQSWEVLALVESAGEAIIFLPTGAMAMLWYRKRWHEAAARRKEMPQDLSGSGQE